MWYAAMVLVSATRRRDVSRRRHTVTVRRPPPALALRLYNAAGCSYAATHRALLAQGYTISDEWLRQVLRKHLASVRHNVPIIPPLPTLHACRLPIKVRDRGPLVYRDPFAANARRARAAAVVFAWSLMIVWLTMPVPVARLVCPVVIAAWILAVW